MAAELVLIVDDNSINKKLFNDILQFSGYRTMMAGNGKEAINIVSGKKPDLVLMDIRMPVINGYEAVKIMKSDPDIQSVPVIALTGYAMKDDRKKALDAGFDGYITKPIDVKEFIKTVKSYF